MPKIRHKKTGKIVYTDKWGHDGCVIAVSNDNLEWAYNTIAELCGEVEE